MKLRGIPIFTGLKRALPELALELQERLFQTALIIIVY